MEEALCFQQLLMRSLLDDLTVVDDDYVICIADGGQAMRDDKTGASFHEA